ncbi:MAG TPA: NAD(P)/FAD-dependent oxidoreductase [Pirellulales bacterium]|jgi:phytoene dehydrogenase-like protein
MYDVAIIGAGMSGLAAGIRLAMFGQQVCILERHYAVGGLNSYYRIDGRNYDVGLHALTNFAARGAKQGPLPRLLRQLRLSWDDFELAEQGTSSIDFPGVRLRFSNDSSQLATEIRRLFPSETDRYQGFLERLLGYDQLQQAVAATSARQTLAKIFREPLLAEMLLCPVLYYGGPREHDIDWGSFSILFRSIFLEGLARPRTGIRAILKHLTKRYKHLGGELRLRAGVRKIVEGEGRAQSILLDDGSELTARQIVSSAGWNETMRMCQAENDSNLSSHPNFTEAGRLTFIESICTLDCQPRELSFDNTIVFYNNSSRFNYACPDDFADLNSGIVCSPNNYCYQDAKIDPAEGTLRLTALANFDRWAGLGNDEYQQQKLHWHRQLVATAGRFVPNLASHIVANDTFTPKTIVHFTGHDNGAVYGAPRKRYDAKTHLENLFICGADQGFVGIIGTLTSGIQVANMLLRASTHSLTTDS